MSDIEIRECTSCGKRKKPDEFRSPKKGKICRECRNESSRARWIKWRDENRERYNATVRSYRAKRYEREGRWRDTSPKSVAAAKWMAEIKSNPCVDCGNKFDACCMDFDHVRGEKVYNIGSMFAHHYSKDLIEAELAKCELVCSNCHRIRTRDRRIGSGKNARIQRVSEVIQDQ